MDTFLVKRDRPEFGGPEFGGPEFERSVIPRGMDDSEFNGSVIPKDIGDTALVDGRVMSDLPEGIRSEVMPHQRKVCEATQIRWGILNYFEMGLGKTFAGFISAMAMREARRIYEAIVSHFEFTTLSKNDQWLIRRSLRIAQTGRRDEGERCVSLSRAKEIMNQLDPLGTSLELAIEAALKDPILILCPAGVISTWVKEIITRTHYSREQILVTHASMRQQNSPDPSDVVITISSHDSTFVELKRFANKKDRLGQPWVKCPTKDLMDMLLFRKRVREYHKANDQMVRDLLDTMDPLKREDIRRNAPVNPDPDGSNGKKILEKLVRLLREVELEKSDRTIMLLDEAHLMRNLHDVALCIIVIAYCCTGCIQLTGTPFNNTLRDFIVYAILSGVHEFHSLIRMPPSQTSTPQNRSIVARFAADCAVGGSKRIIMPELHGILRDTVVVDMDPEHVETYSKMIRQLEKAEHTYITKRNFKNHSAMLVILQRLLMVTSSSSLAAGKCGRYSDMLGPTMCGHCMNAVDIEDPGPDGDGRYIRLPCKHLLHKDCVPVWKKKTCIQCVMQTNLDREATEDTEDSVPIAPSSVKSSKFQKVAEIVRTSDGPLAVASQFTSVLGLFGHHISTTDPTRNVYKIVGSMSPAQRAKELNSFNDECDEWFRTGAGLLPPLMMLSDAGGIGINLNRCIGLIHLDLRFNPATNAQMETRVDRIDSVCNRLKIPIKIWYVAVRNTVDEAIQVILDRKSKEGAVVVPGFGEFMLPQRTRDDDGGDTKVLVDNIRMMWKSYLN
jgi:SNF2 family DNA or RNA helicase